MTDQSKGPELTDSELEAIEKRAEAAKHDRELAEADGERWADYETQSEFNAHVTPSAVVALCAALRARDARVAELESEVESLRENPRPHLYKELRARAEAAEKWILCNPCTICELPIRPDESVVIGDGPSTDVPEDQHFAHSHCYRQRDALREATARAERAEAACAQMRAALDGPLCQCSDYERSVGHLPGCISGDVLASDCGKGWVSPEVHAEVVRERDRAIRERAEIQESRLRLCDEHLECGAQLATVTKERDEARAHAVAAEKRVANAEEIRDESLGRAERAEAACAQMREALTSVRIRYHHAGCEQTWEHHRDCECGKCFEPRACTCGVGANHETIDAALATDVGSGYVEPQTHAAVVNDCIRWKTMAGVLTKERDAYLKAKQENDERFMNERDEARAQLAVVTKERNEARSQAILDALDMVDVLRSQAQSRLDSTGLRHLREAYEAEVSALEDAAHDIATLKDESAVNYRFLYEEASADRKRIFANYYDLADAIAPNSGSVDELAAKARAARAQLATLTKERDEARAERDRYRELMDLHASGEQELMVQLRDVENRRADAEVRLGQVRAQLAEVTKERDEARSQHQRTCQAIALGESALAQRVALLEAVAEAGRIVLAMPDGDSVARRMNAMAAASRLRDALAALDTARRTG